ncbi:IS66-like element accessory protein TnpA [Sphingomonas sp. UYP23]
MTVFGGPERRRRWSEEERLQILAEAFAPGAFVAQVARRHDVSTALIYTWRRKLCQPVAETGTSLPAEAGFAEAVVVDDQRADQAPSQPAIVIDLARVGRVNIFASAPPALAAAVLKAVMR